MRKRLNEFSPQAKPTSSAGKRGLAELVRRSHQLKEAEERKKAEAARLNHITEMKALAKREPQAWQEVDRLLESGQKSATVYDQATAQLEKLKQLAEFQNTRDVFFTRVRQLAGKCASRPSLIRRWQEKGWI
jgi:hypothetical protein